jgi:hypothetical protein
MSPAAALAEPAAVEAIDVLHRMRARLESPSAWVQGSLARGTDGRSCKALDDRACAWCLIGAIAVELRDTPWGDPRGVAQELAVTVGLPALTLGLTLAGWNDDPRRTHDEVLDAIDETIARLRTRPALGVAS